MDLSQLLSFLTFVGIVGGSSGIWYRLSRLETRMNGSAEDMVKLKTNCPIFGNVQEPVRKLSDNLKA